MKKILISAIALCLVASAGYPQKFSFKLSGGIGYALGNDLTKGIQGQSDYLKQEYGLAAGFKIPQLGTNFAGEVIFYPWPNFGVGVGAGYLQIAKESQVTYTIGPLNVTEKIKPAITAIPLALNLHYLFRFSPRLRLDLTAGASYYLTTLKWDYQTDYSISTLKGNDHYTFSAKKKTIGYQGGLGLEYSLTSELAVFLNVLARYASLGPIEGGSWTDNSSGDFEVFSLSGSDHSFWYYERQAGGQNFAQIAFRSEQPSGDPNLSNVRQAKLALTGFAATIGFKISLGR